MDIYNNLYLISESWISPKLEQEILLDSIYHIVSDTIY